ncbi:MAG: hypothetical protein WKF84_18690 [Pyrinomonadaceae bacterium]
MSGEPTNLATRPDGSPVRRGPKSRFLFPGGNLGGPVLIPGTGFNKNSDKLFFFTGYEYYYQKLDTGCDSLGCADAGDAQRRLY